MCLLVNVFPWISIYVWEVIISHKSCNSFPWITVSQSKPFPDNIKNFKWAYENVRQQFFLRHGTLELT